MRTALVLLVACSSAKPVKREEPSPPPIDAAIADAPIDAAIVVDAIRDAAPALTQMKMRSVAGPFPSIKAYCASLKSEALDEPGHKVKCDTRALWTGKRKLDKPIAPFDEARLFVVEGLDPHCQLGMRIGKNWYVLHEAIRCLGERAKSSLATKVVALDAIDVFNEAAFQIVVRAEYDQSLEEYSPEAFDRTRFEAMTICGVGRSGSVSCTRELPMSGTREEHVQGKQPVKSSFKLDFVAFVGEITINGDTSTIEQYLFAPLAAGPYSVTF